MRNLPHTHKVAFPQLFRNANPDALDLLDKMLAFDPAERISVEHALEHAYLQIWHDASDEPSCPTTFDFHFEVVEDIGEMKLMILDEVRRFRHHVRGGPTHQPLLQQPQQLQQQQQHPGTGHTNVPIPEHYDPRSREDPKPQEATFAPAANADLERQLQGLDAMRA